MDIPPNEEDLINHFLYGEKISGEEHEIEYYDIESIVVSIGTVIALLAIAFI